MTLVAYRDLGTSLVSSVTMLQTLDDSYHISVSHRHNLAQGTSGMQITYCALGGAQDRGCWDLASPLNLFFLHPLLL